MKPIIILACSARKAWDVEPDAPKQILADNAYRGRLFLAGQQYAVTMGVPYLILSAKYGLIHPTEVIENYNTVISGNHEPKISHQFTALTEGFETIMVVGGMNYVNLIKLHCLTHDKTLSDPLKGLGIGLKYSTLIGATLGRKELWK